MSVADTTTVESRELDDRHRYQEKSRTRNVADTINVESHESED